MTLTKRFPILGSSVDPNKISLTIKSTGLILVPVVVLIARSFGFEVVDTDLVQVVNALSGMVGMGGVIYGVYRKYFN